MDRRERNGIRHGVNIARQNGNGTHQCLNYGDHKENIRIKGTGIQIQHIHT